MMYAKRTLLMCFCMGSSLCAALELQESCSQPGPSQSTLDDETSLIQRALEVKVAQKAEEEAQHERLYLPKSVDGHQVLDLVDEEKGLWLAHKKRVLPDKVGIHFRRSKNHEDRHPDQLNWGEHLYLGVDEGDGWVSFARTDVSNQRGDLHVARLLKQFSKSNAETVRNDHAERVSSSTCHKDTPSSWDKDTWWQLNEVHGGVMEHCPHAVAAGKRHGLTCMDHLFEKVGIDDRLCSVCAASCAAEAQACPCEGEDVADSSSQLQTGFEVQSALQQRSQSSALAGTADMDERAPLSTMDTSVSRKDDDLKRYESVRAAIEKYPHCEAHTTWYLPKKINGETIIEYDGTENKYKLVASNTLRTAHPDGIAWRFEKDNAKREQSMKGPMWGDYLPPGQDDGDWMKFSATFQATHTYYLPKKFQGETIIEYDEAKNKYKLVGSPTFRTRHPIGIAWRSEKDLAKRVESMPGPTWVDDYLPPGRPDGDDWMEFSVPSQVAIASGCWQTRQVGPGITGIDVYDEMCGGDDGLWKEVVKTKRHKALAYAGQCRYGNNRYTRIGYQMIKFSGKLDDFKYIEGKDCQADGIGNGRTFQQRKNFCECKCQNTPGCTAYQYLSEVNDASKVAEATKSGGGAYNTCKNCCVLYGSGAFGPYTYGTGIVAELTFGTCNSEKNYQCTWNTKKVRSTVRCNQLGSYFKARDTLKQNYDYDAYSTAMVTPPFEDSLPAMCGVSRTCTADQPCPNRQRALGNEVDLAHCTDWCLRDQFCQWMVSTIPGPSGSSKEGYCNFLDSCEANPVANNMYKLSGVSGTGVASQATRRLKVTGHWYWLETGQVNFPDSALTFTIPAQRKVKTGELEMMIDRGVLEDAITKPVAGSAKIGFHVSECASRCSKGKFLQKILDGQPTCKSQEDATICGCGEKLDRDGNTCVKCAQGWWGGDGAHQLPACIPFDKNHPTYPDLAKRNRNRDTTYYKGVEFKAPSLATTGAAAGSILPIIEDDIQFGLNAETLHDKEEVTGLPPVITAAESRLLLLQTDASVNHNASHALQLHTAGRVDGFRKSLDTIDDCVKKRLAEENAQDGADEDEGDAIEKMANAQTHCTEIEVDTLNKAKPQMEIKFSKAQEEYEKAKTKTEQCYLALVQIEAAKATKEGNDASKGGIPTDPEEARRYEAEARYDAAKHTKMTTVNRKWMKAEQDFEQYENRISDLEAQVKWFPSMKASLISFLLEGLPDAKCLMSENWCEGATSLNDAGIRQQKAREDEAAGGASLTTDVHHVVVGFLPETTPRTMLRTIAAEQLELRVKTPVLGTVTSLLDHAWSMVDILVNAAIATLSSLVGAVPFVGGVLSTIVTMAMMYVYDSLKRTVNLIINGMVTSLLDKFINGALDLAFGTARYAWTANGAEITQLSNSLKAVTPEQPKAKLPSCQGGKLPSCSDCQVACGDAVRAGCAESCFDVVTPEQLAVLTARPGGLIQAVFPSNLIEAVIPEGDMLGLPLGDMQDMSVQKIGSKVRGLADDDMAMQFEKEGSMDLGEADYHEYQTDAYCEGTIPLEFLVPFTVQECANKVVRDTRCGKYFNFVADSLSGCQCVPINGDSTKAAVCAEKPIGDGNPKTDIYILDDEQWRDSWAEGLPAWFSSASEIFGKEPKDLLEKMEKVPRHCAEDTIIDEHNRECERIPELSFSAMSFGVCMNAAIKCWLNEPAGCSMNAFNYMAFKNTIKHEVETGDQASTKNCIMYHCKAGLKTQKDDTTKGWTVYSTNALCPAPDLGLLQQGAKTVQTGLLHVPDKDELDTIFQKDLAADTKAQKFEKWEKSLPKKEERDSINDVVKLEVQDVAIGEAEEARDREAQKAERKAEVIQGISSDYSAAMGGGDTV
jgi:hypothetical protein